MSLFTRFIKNAVGNNMHNKEEDVLKIKTLFSQEGRYKTPIENGIYDRELDTSIKSFQKENNLKRDGVILPGRETEAHLVSHTAVFPTRKPDKNEARPKSDGTELARSRILKETAAKYGPAAWGVITEIWKNMKPEEREQETREIENKTISEETRKRQCDKGYNKDVKHCNRVTNSKGNNAGRLCHEKAVNEYSECLAGK